MHALLADARTRLRRRAEQTNKGVDAMKRALVWIVPIVLIAIAAIAYYVWYRPAPAPVPAARIEAPVPPPAPAPAKEEAQAEPEIAHPIEQTQAAETEKPRPITLNDSDDAILGALAPIIDPKRLRQYAVVQEFARHVVATIDNLPREKVSSRINVVRRTPGPFQTLGGEDDRTLNPANYARYQPAVQFFESLDARGLAALYVRFYPLFQEAYRELGYPSGYFNDRLVAVIDHMLAAPNVQRPIKLVQPKVFFQFADPELEAKSAGHKIMIRIGEANASKVKAKLREFRAAVTAKKP